ncbi:hypothetical protein EH228_08815 [Erwinia endophytica]|uniref:conserved phage C-terminal domain-containing protein n=1 Tax=Erwinia endophytica TaxID=1563158 RepID=UPI001265F0B7|nr:conserved phage C-terminal domain-containing protein [Erwinia endophytica]KAB8312271.1 hypothetical protein EH228_08815 [Erwinia endophytica]
MSSKLHGLVWEGCAHSGMILSRVAVMARLADYSNDEGLSWPSIETIQRQIGAKSKATVSAAITELEAAGWLVKTGRRVNGRSLSNLYHLNIEKLEAAAAAAAAARQAVKQKKRNTPPNIDPLINNPSNIDPPAVEGSTVEGSNIEKESPERGSIVGPDPLLNSKQDPSDKKISCQAGSPDDPAQRVLDYFNNVTGSRYRDGKTTMGYIRGRLSDPEFVADDLILVVDYLTAKWLNDPRMCDYLRPKTIFSPENFPDYFERARRWNTSGRPACVDGRWLKPGESPTVPVDAVERDAAFTRLVAQGHKPAGRVEELAKIAAGKIGLGRMNENTARASWKSIWAQAVAQAHEERTRIPS